MSSDDESHPLTPGPSKSSTKETKPKAGTSTSDIKKDLPTSERDIRHMERAYDKQQQELVAMRKQLQDVLSQRQADIAHMHELEARLQLAMVQKDAGNVGDGDHQVVHVSSQPDNDGDDDDMHELDDGNDGGMVDVSPVIGNKEAPLELPKIPNQSNLTLVKVVPLCVSGCNSLTRCVNHLVGLIVSQLLCVLCIYMIVHNNGIRKRVPVLLRRTRGNSLLPLCGNDSLLL